jgi:MFS family permease
VLSGSSLLTSRPFRLLASARTLLMLGNSIAPVALAFAVLDLHSSASALGIVVGARSLANVVFLLFGGVLADRLPRQLILVGSSLGGALSQSAVAALVLSQNQSLVALAGFAALNGALAAFAFPASAALLPSTVSAEQRRSANAVIRLGANGAMVVGGAAAGILVAVIGSGWAIAVDSATFALAAVLFAGIRVPRPTDLRSTTPRASTASEPDAVIIRGPRLILRELGTGWREFRSHQWVWTVVLGAMLINAAYLGAVQVVGPTVADAIIGRSAWGFVLAAQTVGLVLGGLWAMRSKNASSLPRGVAFVAAMSLLPLALALAPVPVLLVLAAVLAGIGLEQFGVAWETAVQTHIADDRLARIYSLDAFGSSVAVPLGVLSAGAAADAFGAEQVLIAAAAITVAASATLLVVPSVRRLPGNRPQGPLEPSSAADSTASSPTTVITHGRG